MRGEARSTGIASTDFMERGEEGGGASREGGVGVAKDYVRHSSVDEGRPLIS